MGHGDDLIGRLHASTASMAPCRCTHLHLPFLHTLLAEHQLIEALDLIGGADAQRRPLVDARDLGVELAKGAWADRLRCDALVEPCTPEWPTHRQPMIDRNILRLALHEIAVAEVPPKVAINDAVELAKEYGGEKSPAFVNAVLDRIWKAGDSEGVSNPDGEGAS